MIAVYDKLAKFLYDSERGIEYSPLCCMNNENIANRIKITGAKPCIYAVNASERFNSDIALLLRNTLQEKKINFLVDFNTAYEEILPKIPEYISSPSADIQLFYEAPFLETQELFNEMINLTYEKKVQTGLIKISEKSMDRKDRFTSLAYLNYVCKELENEYLSSSEEYEFGIFVN